MKLPRLHALRKWNDKASRFVATEHPPITIVNSFEYQEYISLLDSQELVEQAKEEALNKEWIEIHKWKPWLHFCYGGWDGLLIDKNDEEFQSCECGMREKLEAQKKKRSVTRGPTEKIENEDDEPIF